LLVKGDGTVSVSALIAILLARHVAVKYPMPGRR
jgi:hypothetical protein